MPRLALTPENRKVLEQCGARQYVLYILAEEAKRVDSDQGVTFEQRREFYELLQEIVGSPVLPPIKSANDLEAMCYFSKDFVDPRREKTKSITEQLPAEKTAPPEINSKERNNDPISFLMMETGLSRNTLYRHARKIPGLTPETRGKKIRYQLRKEDVPSAIKYLKEIRPRSRGRGLEQQINSSTQEPTSQARGTSTPEFKPVDPRKVQYSDTFLARYLQVDEGQFLTQLKGVINIRPEAKRYILRTSQMQAIGGKLLTTEGLEKFYEKNERNLTSLGIFNREFGAGKVAETKKSLKVPTVGFLDGALVVTITDAQRIYTILTTSKS